MKTIAVDTNIFIDMLHGDETFRKTLASSQSILVSPVVCSEILVGFDDTRAGRAAKERFRRFLELPIVSVPPIDRGTAELHAEIRRQLRKAGTPIPQNDIWIAAMAMEHGAVLCTRDGDFRAVANLRIVAEP